MESKEIIGFQDLGSGMTLKRQTGIGIRHSLTIVDHLNGGSSSIYYQHMDRHGPRIDSILHQFLDNGCRTLDHLTSGDLVGYTVWKEMDHVCHFFPLQLKMSSRLSGRI